MRFLKNIHCIQLLCVYKNAGEKCKKREYLNYSTYDVYGHTLDVSAYSTSLTLFLQLLQNQFFHQS